MYWNTIVAVGAEFVFVVEPQHKMYWNYLFWVQIGKLNAVEPQHKMYWNTFMELMEAIGLVLNRNIRCIEIQIGSCGINILVYVEPQHKMYWNVTIDIVANVLTNVEP